MKKTKTQNPRLAEIDREIARLQCERATLTDVVNAPNRLYTNIFAVNNDGSYDDTIDFEDTKSVLEAINFIEENINELKSLIKGSTKIKWYGPYHEDCDEDEGDF